MIRLIVLLLILLGAYALIKGYMDGSIGGDTTLSEAGTEIVQEGENIVDDVKEAAK